MQPAPPTAVTLAPVPAMELVAASLMPPFGGDPNGALTRRTHPPAFHPAPVAAAPIPVAVGPDISRTGSPADRDIRTRGRRRIAGIIPAASAAARQEGGAHYQCSCQQLQSHDLPPADGNVQSRALVA